jgi:hypothetical protein
MPLTLGIVIVIGKESPSLCIAGGLLVSLGSPFGSLSRSRKEGEEACDRRGACFLGSP